MSMSIVLGILSIMVSVAVGLGTYWLADRRSRRSRWEGAKDIILRDLSKSLGEGTVPSTDVILATIRSVLRGQSAPDLAVVTLQEVKDDLLRQITADPFLDRDRRKELQTQVLHLEVGEMWVPLSAPEVPEPMMVKKFSELQVEMRRKARLAGSFVAILAGVFASALAGTALIKSAGLLEKLRAILASDMDSRFFLVPVVGATLTVLASVISIFMESSRSTKKGRGDQ